MPGGKDCGLAVFHQKTERMATRSGPLGLLVKTGLTASRSEARRAVEQGGVSANGEKVTDIKRSFTKEELSGEGITLRRGKKSYKKAVME